MGYLRLTSMGFVVLSTLSAACAAPTARPEAEPPGETRAAGPKQIVAAIRGDPRTLNDAINFAAGGSSVAGVREIEQLLHAGLTITHPDGLQHPQLAEAAPTVENGLWKLLPDGRMETTWKIKPNARWHDGQPVTAEDMVFTARVAQDRSLPMRRDVAAQFLDRVEAPDPRTVVGHWKSPYIEADRLFSTRILPMPKHLLERTFEEDRATFTESPVFGQGFVGAGPYRLQEWVLGSHISLVANEEYVLGRPKIDQIQVRFILDTNTIIAYALAAALDMTLGRGLTPEQAIIVRQAWKEGTVDAGLQNTTQLRPQFLNSQPALLTDVRFRRALLHALDRQQIVDTFLEGLVPIGHSIITPEHAEYRDVEPLLVRYDYDPRRSIELLEGLGLARGPDGIYRDASGKILSVEVRTRTHPLREKVQQVIAQEWRRIGVIGELAVVPEQRVTDREYQATYPGFYFRFGGPQVEEFHGCCLPLPENNFSGSNSTRYRNSEMDELIDRYRTTIPRGERLQVLGRIIHHLTDQLVILPIYHEPEPMLIGNRLVGVMGSRSDAGQAWNAHLWDTQ